MTQYRYIFLESAKAEFLALPAPLRVLFLEKLVYLLRNPYRSYPWLRVRQGARHPGEWRFHPGECRVFYRVDSVNVVFTRIKKRPRAYARRAPKRKHERHDSAQSRLNPTIVAPSGRWLRCPEWRVRPIRGFDGSLGPRSKWTLRSPGKGPRSPRLRLRGRVERALLPSPSCGSMSRAVTGRLPKRCLRGSPRQSRLEPLLGPRSAECVPRSQTGDKSELRTQAHRMLAAHLELGHP